MCLALFLILIVHWSDGMFLLHFRILGIPGMGDQLHCLERRGFWANITGGALVLKSLPTPSLKQARGKKKRKKKNRQGRPLVAACISRWTHTAQRHKSWMLWAWDGVGYRKGSNRAIGCLMAKSQTPPQGPHSGRVCPRQWVGSLYMVLMKSGWLLSTDIILFIFPVDNVPSAPSSEWWPLTSQEETDRRHSLLMDGNHVT